MQTAVSSAGQRGSEQRLCARISNQGSLEEGAGFTGTSGAPHESGRVAQVSLQPKAVRA